MSDTAPDIRVKSTPAFKLKNKPSRCYQAIHLKKQFGFVPEVIIVEKVMGYNNAIIVRAVLTDEEKAKEDKIMEEQKKAKRLLRVEKHKNGESSTK